MEFSVYLHDDRVCVRVCVCACACVCVHCLQLTVVIEGDIAAELLPHQRLILDRSECSPLITYPGGCGGGWGVSLVWGGTGALVYKFV